MWTEKAERWLDLPDGALTGDVRLEVDGRHRLTAVGSCEILEYEPDCIRLKTKSGEVCILGDGLVVEAFHPLGVVIGGHLLAVEFR